MTEQKWAAGSCEETFESPMLDSKEAAIEYVKNELDGSGWIGKAFPVRLVDVMNRLWNDHFSNIVVEALNEAAYEEMGEAADEFIVLSSDDMEELNMNIEDAIVLFFKRKGTLFNSYKVIDQEFIDLTEDDDD